MRRVVVSAVILLCTRASWAQAADGSAAAAQTAFEEAKTLAQEGRWPEACKKLEESNRLEPRHTTMFRLADCYERTGRPASAWSKYVSAATGAAAAGEAQRAAFARERANRLEPTLPRVVVSVSDAPSGNVTVSKDGEVVPPTLYDTKLPVDPGEHTFSATAPNKDTFIVKVNVPAERVVLVVAIPQLHERRAAATRPASSPVSDAPSAQPSTAGAFVAQGPSPDGRSELRTWGFVFGSVGLLSLAAGLTSFIVTETGSGCVEEKCAPAAVAMVGGSAMIALATGIFLAAATGDFKKAARSPLTLSF